ncbi:MAG TPA: hypothetical protein VGG12_09520 [Methylovirgula sp.]
MDSGDIGAMALGLREEALRFLAFLGDLRADVRAFLAADLTFLAARFFVAFLAPFFIALRAPFLATFFAAFLAGLRLVAFFTISVPLC